LADLVRMETLFTDMLKINSPSKKERGMADYTTQFLKSIGFDVYEDDASGNISGDAGNVIGFRKGSKTGPALLFSCHIDTVEPTETLTIVRDGDEFRSDGTTILGADDKAGVAAVLEGLRLAVESGEELPNIQVIFDVAEEIGLLGCRELDRSAIKADVAYVFDTEKPVGGITLSAPTQANIHITIEGVATHAGLAPEKGISAIVAASNAIAKMKLGRLDDETTANIGIINGGRAGNIVPDSVKIKAEARSRNESKLEAQIVHMKELFESEAKAIGAKATVEVNKEFRAFQWTAEDTVVKMASKACKQIGLPVVLQQGGGGSDANVFNTIGLPAVVIGVGYEGAHSRSEHVSLTDLLKAAECVKALATCDPD